MIEHINEPAKKTRIRARYDVIVCGGGTAGITAAIASARGGASTALVESSGFCGGVATQSGVNGVGGWQYDLDGRPLISGVPLEIMRRVAELGGADLKQVDKLSRPIKTPNYKDGGLGCFWIRVNPELYKIALDRMLLESGVHLYYHTLVSEPILEDSVISGVFIESKSGREALRADVLIDCTGDGDIASRAGESFFYGRDEDSACQPMTTIFTVSADDCPKLKYDVSQHAEDGHKDLSANRYAGAVSLARKRNEINRNPNDILCSATPLTNTDRRIFSVNFTRIQSRSAIDIDELTSAEIDGREQVIEAIKFMRKYVEGCGNAELLFIPPRIGIRESRRIRGQYCLTQSDILNSTVFPDTICRGIYLMDIHNPTEIGKPSVLKLLDQPYSIPYRCLVPLKTKGLLMAGRCISGDHSAHASFRIQSHCMAVGQAAGAAAALAIKNRVTPDSIDIRELRNMLNQSGVNTGESL